MHQERCTGQYADKQRLDGRRHSFAIIAVFGLVGAPDIKPAIARRLYVRVNELLGSTPGWRRRKTALVDEHRQGFQPFELAFDDIFHLEIRGLDIGSFLRNLEPPGGHSGPQLFG